METLAAFVGVSLLVIMSPGQDTALTVRSTIAGGRRAGVFTALGVVSGQCVWALATSAGVVAILLASEPLFLALKFAGAAFLVYLGAQALWAAVRRRPPSGLPPARGLTPATAYRQGVLSNLANPKIAAFFSSLLPQFATDFFALLALGLTFAALTLAWLCLYAVVVARAGDVLRRPALRRAIDGVTGGVLVGLGVRLATWRSA